MTPFLPPRRFGADALSLVCLAVLVLLLFRHTVFGEAALIGNSDRLNTCLNVLKFHAEGLRDGTFSTWNEYTFAGMDTFGIIYTFPSPLTLIASLADENSFLYVANLLSFALLWIAGVAAYAFIKDVCRDPLFAFVGAALYEMSFLAVFTLCQNDLTFLVFPIMPLALLALRRVAPTVRRGPFLALTFFLFLLLFFTFLQPVVYALMLFGAYAAHRAWQANSWAPLYVFAAALLCAGVLSYPRLATIRTDLAESMRSRIQAELDGGSYIRPFEILRFFHEGAYGRDQEHIFRLGNVLNNSEGILLYVSSFAPFLLLMGMARYRGGWLRLFRPSEGDAAFFLWALLGCFALIFVKPLAYGVYLAFGRAQLHHGRLIFVALLPTCALIAVVLRDWAGDRRRDGGRAVAGGAALAAVVLIALLQSLAGTMEKDTVVRLDQPALRLTRSCWRVFWFLEPHNALAASPVEAWHACFSGVYLCSAALRQIFWSAIVVGTGTCSLSLRPGERRRWLVTTLGLLMVGQTFLSANYRVNANYDRPPQSTISNNSDVQVARLDEFRPPSPAARAAFRDRLETDRFRTVLAGAPICYTCTVPPHLSLFWNLRLFEGYGTSVPTRLYALPFPASTIEVQRLSYNTLDEVNWRMLSLLNVKYAVQVNAGMYRNRVTMPNGERREATPDDVTILENPHPVVPRAFFTAACSPVDDVSAGVVALFGEGIIPAKPGLFQHIPEAKRAEISRRELAAGRCWPDRLTVDVIEHSFVEGMEHVETFEREGAIDADFRGDAIHIRVTPAHRPRFLVLNELYHPSWRATVDGQPTAIYPTNVFMRGLVVPAGTSSVELAFVPFVASRSAVWFYAAGLALTALGSGCLGSRQPTHPRQTTAADAQQCLAYRQEIQQREGLRRSMRAVAGLDADLAVGGAAVE